MARDRRRAKQRRDRQARAAGRPQARPVDSGSERKDDVEQLHEHEPAELASGEIDLADAQLALGRPELTDATQPGPDDLTGAAGEADVEGAETAFEALEDRVDEAEAAFEEGGAGNGHVDDGADVVRSRRRRPARATEPREGNRLATFLRGSWRELQRVQWPDRRQVGQATAVVVGFVIVAGAFLGLADFVAGKIVDYII
ncbi:MAG TPA: preprotein translocase subunit SecE [Conexibacter sp.]|nr:preprotein translocase subunit SecE [Conexibacter sp.]